MIFVGVDWAGAHHDICVLDETGAVVSKKRIPDTLAGVAMLHEILAKHADNPEEVLGELYRKVVFDASAG